MYYRSEFIELVYLPDCKTSFPIHNHVNMYVIGLVLKGEVLFKSLTTEQCYQQDEYFVIAPYEAHAIQANNSNAYSLLSICLHKKWVDRTADTTLQHLIQTLLFAFAQQHALNSGIHEIAQKAMQPLLLKKRQINSKAAWFVNLPQCTTESNDHSKSGSYQARNFKQRTGLSLHQFEIQNRIRHAQRLMDTNILLTEVAHSCGFYDQSHFIHTFKQWVGLTPKAYRASVHQITFNKAQEKIWQTDISLPHKR